VAISTKTTGGDVTDQEHERQGDNAQDEKDREHLGSQSDGEDESEGRQGQVPEKPGQPFRSMPDPEDQTP